MRRWTSLFAGVLIGQWLAFGGAPAPSRLDEAGRAAWERQDYAEALRVWSHAVARQPDNSMLHYRRATALEQLGQPQSAADAYRLVLLLEPPRMVARLAREALVKLEARLAQASGIEATVPLQPARGVWVAPVVLNETRQARFLVDTGSSVTLVSPALAADLGLDHRESREAIELQTLGGLTAGLAVSLASIRVGRAKLNDIRVVVHDPGPELDGILGNSFLGQWRVTLDADRRFLHLRSLGRD